MGPKWEYNRGMNTSNTKAPARPRLTVTYSLPTCIPGYEPAYTLYTGDDWGTAYEFAKAQVPVIASSNGAAEYRCEPSIEVFYTALRDDEPVAKIDVFSHQSAITLGRPFESRRLGTITVQAA